MLHLGELPLRGAAGMGEGGGCFGGGAPAARGCPIEGGRRLLWGELPLRGAARFEGRKRLLRLGEIPLRGAARQREGGISCFRGSSRCAGLLDSKEGRGCFVWGSSRCAELLGWGREEADSGGAPASLREAYTNSSGNHGTKPEKY